MVLRSTLSRVSLAIIAAVIAVVLISAFNIGLPSYDSSYAQNGSPIASPSAVPNSPTATATVVEPTATIPEETNTPVVCEDQYFKNGICETPVVSTPTPDSSEAEPTIQTDEPISELPSTGAGSTAREVLQSEHTYTTTYGYCWKFVSGVYYYRERTTTWVDNWWGSGHYAAYVSEVQYGRCLIG